MPNREVDEFFNALYQKTKDKVLVYIIAKCGDTEDIHDIFQETFLEVVKLLKRKGTEYFQEPEAVVMAIAKQKIYRHFSFRKRLETIKQRYEASENVEEEMTDFEDFSLEDAMVREEMLEQVREILGKQDILTKKVFYLKFYMDVTMEQISKMLGVSESVVKNRLYRTIKKIKRELEEGGDVL